MQTNQHASEPLHRSLDISIPRMCPERSCKGTWRVWCLLSTLSFCNEIGNLIIMSTPCSSNTKTCRKDKEGENEWQDNQGNYHYHLSLPTSFLHHHGYVFLQTSPKSQTRLVVLAFAVFISCPAQKLTLMPWPFLKPLLLTRFADKAWSWQKLQCWTPWKAGDRPFYGWQTDKEELADIK
jgi:hypothetical protein